MRKRLLTSLKNLKKRYLKVILHNDQNHETRVNNWNDSFNFYHMPIEIYFERAEISKKIKNLNIKKAPRPDNISNTVIKYLEPSISKILYQIFNASYNVWLLS